ncbi:putative transposase [Paenibacillus uliginis N3/975]|uniref:Putative transposase n=1 Tax=Paenibacillus uliginis N3/975 TaxID=1313296 RepID=A0A1X7HL97_9BACL|nr:IS3 family transposase [Paenibacillus uliginis]SMF88825.1 putative transposase [Paenibacillus uliginis N3/975]
MARQWILKGYPVSKILKLCNVPRSTYYYQRKTTTNSKQSNKSGRPKPGYSVTFNGKKVSDGRIKQIILKLLEGEESAYGYRKITLVLRRRHAIKINKKKVYRLCKELDILGKPKEQKAAYPRRLANNMEVTGPNQLWQMDVKYGYIAGLQRYFYTASIIDVYDRNVVGQYRGKECLTKSLVDTLYKALIKRNIFSQEKELVIRTDNGPQFKSHKFGKFFETHKEFIIHERTPNRSPNKNAFIESFHSILERECFKRHIFTDFQEAFMVLDRFMDFYNNRRIHMSLYGYSPVEFAEKLKKNEVNAFKIAV